MNSYPFWEETPTFYAIIPASVRYSQITPNAKLLYWEITALSNKLWCCFASNSYFAKLYWVNERQISRWINELKNCWFITVQIIKETGNKREIYIEQNIDTYRQKRLYLPTKKTIAIDKKDHSYNRYNIKYNNKIIIEEEKEKNLEIEIDNNYIESLEEFRLFLNKGKLQEKYFYKIGNLDSFERMTSEFFLYMEDKWKKINKKTAEIRFCSFLKPNWETDEDRNNLISAYNRKKQKSNISINSDKLALEQKEKEKQEYQEMLKEWKKLDNLLTTEQKNTFLAIAEYKINKLTKWYWKDKPEYQVWIKNKYYKLLIEYNNKKLIWQK